jgi:hypothetical protein
MEREPEKAVRLSDCQAGFTKGRRGKERLCGITLDYSAVLRQGSKAHGMSVSHSTHQSIPYLLGMGTAYLNILSPLVTGWEKLWKLTACM